MVSRVDLGKMTPSDFRMEGLLKPEQERGRRVFKVQILKSRCKGCGLCLLFCKEQALSASSQINELGYFPVEPSEDGKCVGCRNCYLVCPEGIVEIVQENEPSGSGSDGKKRRAKK